ncbi:MAG: dTDP-4-dehydrorhamnose 3,5-epimerase [Bacteroidales bacterium]|nr:dTDP-4-dehydrorhamnose 3,5-epimerase [Bacteroidales bacterium]
MNVINTEIPGVVILEPRVFRDERGWFMEFFNLRDFSAAVQGVNFVQDNQSCSSYGVIRGLHYQKGRSAQSKLVQVLEGRVLDIAVDIRVGSPWFGRHVSVELSADSHRQLFIPRGFAHGFSVLSEKAVFLYKCDAFYDPSSEGAIAWDDPALGIDWKVPAEKAVLSQKDQCHRRLSECEPGELFNYNQDLYA